jgi:hypothetical protein
LPLLDATLALARALAVEARQPEPATLEEALQPPLAGAFGPHTAAIREFLATPAAEARPVTDALTALLGGSPVAPG